MAEKRPICLYSGKLKELASADDIWGKAAILAAANSYTDGVVAGLSWKQMVRTATTTAGTLASSFENGDTIDGVTLATGDRILIKDQADPKENGIYVVAASGAPTRSTDADSGAELVNASVYVSEGTTQADTQWVCTTNATITIGSTNIVFAQFSGGGGPTDEYIQDLVGAMLSGNTETGISVDYQDSDGTIDFVLNDEYIQDVVGAMFSGNTEDGASIDYQDSDGTIDITVKATESFIVAVSDETTVITTGTAKITFRMPYAFTLTDIRASLSTVSSSGNPEVNVKEGGTTIFSTNLTIDASEKTSTTAATPVVISDSSLADDAEMTIDIVTAGTGAKGLKVTFIGHRT